MKTEHGDRGPDPIRRQARPRPRRGQSVLSQLRSTEEFNCETLSAQDRSLILYLVVALADEDGCVSGTYQALVDAHAHEAGHWTRGRTVSALRKHCSKVLGKSASRRPPWEMIRDAVHAGVAEAQREAVLAEAAGLYCRATGLDRPDGDYCGPIRLPAWADATVVTVEQIQAAMAGPDPVADVPARGILDPALDLARQVEESRQLLEATIRAFRAKEREVDQLGVQLDHYRQDRVRVHDVLRENLSLRQSNRRLRSQSSLAMGKLRRMLGILHPGYSQSVLDAMLQEEMRGTGSRRVPSDVEWLQSG